TQEQKIQADNAGADDEFGNSVGIYGDTIIVGARFEDTTASNAGSAYVFTRTGVTWTQQQQLQADNAALDDNFGWSVAIYGDTVAVAAVSEDTTASASGAIYIYTRSGATWTQQQMLKASDADVNDKLGDDISMHMDTIIAGTRFENASAGSAYIFTRSGGTWTEEQKLVASDAAGTDYFGYNVAIHGDTAVIGAYQEDTAVSGAGSVYIFTRSGVTWTEQQILRGPAQVANDQFGYSVAVYGDTIVASAWREDSGGATDSGAAYIFTRTGVTWTQEERLQATAPESSDWFGYSVARHGNAIAVGAYGDNTTVITAGSVYVYDIGIVPNPGDIIRIWDVLENSNRIPIKIMGVNKLIDGESRIFLNNPDKVLQITYVNDTIQWVSIED
ncbi:FG-GAP repeat protein, partial [Candidatus Babeliales bacterium]|nr:FG-GAP repeat protein [Candidatus Babeliales bacterium]